MKVVQLTDENVVKRVYTDIYNPTIYPNRKLIVFSNGRIEGVDNYILVEDHVPAEMGDRLDDSIIEYDQSHNFLDMDIEDIKEEIKEKVEEAKEDIKEFFKDGDNDESKG